MQHLIELKLQTTHLLFNMKNMIPRIAIYTLAACALALVGCGKPEESVAGFYVSEKTPNNTAELRGDGTFLVSEGAQEYVGKYRIEGKKLILELPSGKIGTGTIDGNTIIDQGGERLVKRAVQRGQ